MAGRCGDGFGFKMTPAGLEPAIPGSVGRCLIHWATGPDVFTWARGLAGSGIGLAALKSIRPRDGRDVYVGNVALENYIARRTSLQFITCQLVFAANEQMTAVGFEPTPLRTGAWSQRLRPHGQTVTSQSMCCVVDGNAARTTDNENRKITDLQHRRLNKNLRTGAWFSGITSASHAEGPGSKSQCVHFLQRPTAPKQNHMCAANRILVTLCLQ